jgi:hypothetical protein
VHAAAWQAVVCCCVCSSAAALSAAGMRLDGCAHTAMHLAPPKWLLYCLQWPSSVCWASYHIVATNIRFLVLGAALHHLGLLMLENADRLTRDLCMCVMHRLQQQFACPSIFCTACLVGLLLELVLVLAPGLCHKHKKALIRWEMCRRRAPCRPWRFAPGPCCVMLGKPTRKVQSAAVG